jgi:hypothetical protein
MVYQRGTSRAESGFFAAGKKRGPFQNKLGRLCPRHRLCPGHLRQIQ